MGKKFCFASVSRVWFCGGANWSRVFNQQLFMQGDRQVMQQQSISSSISCEIQSSSKWPPVEHICLLYISSVHHTQHLRYWSRAEWLHFHAQTAALISRQSLAGLQCLEQFASRLVIVSRPSVFLCTDCKALNRSNGRSSGCCRLLFSGTVYLLRCNNKNCKRQRNEHQFAFVKQ